jgi:hypothetical protein
LIEVAVRQPAAGAGKSNPITQGSDLPFNHTMHTHR